MVKQKLSIADPWLAPHQAALQQRVDNAATLKHKLAPEGSVAEFALGHTYFGLHQVAGEWVFREWAPNATAIYLVGDFCRWQDDEQYKLMPDKNGEWEIRLPAAVLRHEMRYKLHIYWPGGNGYRVPAWATRVVQDKHTLEFNAQVWAPLHPYQWHDQNFTGKTGTQLIYEAHIGMAGEHEGVATYADFTNTVLPRIIAAGYTTIQLMAIQEHPYYGSFGYHVSSFFAASSRFGTPEDLKALVDAAHRAGIAVVLDLVHSHAVKNEVEGLSRFDGTLTQYFHSGPRGNHQQWDSRVFDYAKPQVLHFLLSNCRYWLDEYHFDGFRFDGVTSMLYTHHGMGRAFTSYDDYFRDTDPDALAYLTLANELIHQVRPHAITIAEEMSGMPGLAAPISHGGIGFDYRLSMGVPDMWIRLLKEARDEDWDMTAVLHELTQHRPEEKTISYAESHDQALVGDKTIMFRLADKAMYEHMQVGDNSLIIERALALHKLIRLLTAATNSGGYLTFMGNEFGHPEWIDFPREGNNWSYAYARRQWSLADNPALQYRFLALFDRAMLPIIAKNTGACEWVAVHNRNHTVSFMRGTYLFAFNFHPTLSLTGYAAAAPTGDYKLILSSDNEQFGGQGRIDQALTYTARPQTKGAAVQLYLPARTAVVLQRQ